MKTCERSASLLALVLIFLTSAPAAAVVFDERLDFETGHHPRAVAIGDLNNDGYSTWLRQTGTVAISPCCRETGTVLSSRRLVILSVTNPGGSPSVIWIWMETLTWSWQIKTAIPTRF
jgi:hypothetical protein